MNISEYLQPHITFQRAKGEPRNQREELMNIFLETLNKDRVKTGYKPYTYSRLSLLVKGMSEQHLYILLKECQNFPSFGALFHTKVKQWSQLRNEKKKTSSVNKNNAQQVRRVTHTTHQEEVSSLSPQLGL